MRVGGKEIIDDFKKKHPTSRKALNRWLKLVEDAQFNSPVEIKMLFGAAVDFVEGQTIFDIGGNKVRAITEVSFGQKAIWVTHVLTHAEYDRERWKE